MLPLILDTNLLILFSVGLTEPDYIHKYKRLAVYDKIDFTLVAAFVDDSAGLLLNPNVLTETSNLVRYVRDPIGSLVSETLEKLVRGSGEQYVESQQAMRRREYLRLGLTDSVLLTLAASGGTLLTADLDLYLAAATAGLRTINYNHVREQRPEF